MLKAGPVFGDAVQQEIVRVRAVAADVMAWRCADPRPVKPVHVARVAPGTSSGEVDQHAPLRGSSCTDFGSIATPAGTVQHHVFLGLVQFAALN
jgi:hypothetical protein